MKRVIATVLSVLSLCLIILPQQVSALDIQPQHLIHIPSLTGYKAPTTVENGYTGDIICAECGEMLIPGTEIPKVETPDTDVPEEQHLLHCPELINPKAPTDSEFGYTGDLICNECGEVLVTGKMIPPVDKTVDMEPPEHIVHIPELVNAKKPSETTAGYTGDVICKVCGKVLAQGKTIEATGSMTPDFHVHQSKLINTVEPTYLYPGYTGDVVCEECGALLALGETLQPIGMHSYRWPNPFEDVKPLAYYYKPVLWAYYGGITVGTAPNTFSPDQDCTRAQVVTFLWRTMGSPEPRVTECKFEDIEEGSYYHKAVLWAVEHGITKGTGEKTFSPDKICSRGEIVTFLWRVQGCPAPETKVQAFPDVTEGTYYSEAVSWATENKITVGFTDGTFRPNKTCSRAEIVTFLYRAYTD